MNVSLILANPKKESFNHAIARTCLDGLRKNRHNVFFHDLCEERFDPFLAASEIPKAAMVPEDVRRHCDEAAQADGFIVIHPNWWGQPPAILKGWIDRVLRPGVAYEFLPGDKGEGIPRGLLKARYALVFNTGNTVLEREKLVFGDPLETLWKNCIFDLCGVTTFYRKLFGVMITSTEDQRKRWLADVAEAVERFCPKET